MLFNNGRELSVFPSLSISDFDRAWLPGLRKAPRMFDTGIWNPSVTAVLALKRKLRNLQPSVKRVNTCCVTPAYCSMHFSPVVFMSSLESKYAPPGPKETTGNGRTGRHCLPIRVKNKKGQQHALGAILRSPWHHMQSHASTCMHSTVRRTRINSVSGVPPQGCNGTQWHGCSCSSLAACAQGVGICRNEAALGGQHADGGTAASTSGGGNERSQ